MPPVEEHEVHEKVKHDADYKYGCHNRKPYVNDYYAPDRIYRPDGTYYVVQTRIQHSMSRECRYDMSLSDSHCQDCKHRGSGEAYNEKVRAIGK